MIVTQHNDNQRTGGNLAEVILKPSNLQSFGKLFELPVVGAVYAQPLLVPNLTVGNQVRDVLYVATMHNRVYAFDAGAPLAPLWERDLEPSIQLPNPQIGPQPNLVSSGYKDIEWEVGIISTPVIDTDRDAIYVVSATRQADGTFKHDLWKLDLVTGQNLSPPTSITGVSGSQVFDSSKQNQRTGVLLSQNRIYVCFASYGDRRPYHGWVFSFDADTLAALNTFCATPHPDPPIIGQEGRAGIWQAGQGPAADEAGNIYLMTGDGDFDQAQGNYGCSVLKLDANLNVVDFFTPFNQASLNSSDQDLGSGGILVIPGTNFMVGGGKESVLYLMNTNHLGGYNGAIDDVLDKFVVSDMSDNPGNIIPLTHHIHGSPVFWNGPDGPRIYVWTENAQCKAFQFLGDAFNHTLVAKSNVTAPSKVPGGSPGMPGGFLTISANGAQDGILWANHPWAADLNQQIGEGVLHAFDAGSLVEYWNSRDNQARDDFGNFAKFCPPMVANGKVYMATMGGLSHKIPLGESAVGGPALAKRKDYTLILGWSGTDFPSSHLNLMTSRDGLNWQNKVTIPNETTHNALSLAFDNNAPPNGRIFLAWTGTDGRLNVMSSVDMGFQSWDHKNTLAESSGHGPAIVFANGRLFLAWTDGGSLLPGRLNVASSGDLGTSWQNKITLNETSNTEPALALWNGNLILMWSGTDDRLNFIQSADGGFTWGNKVTIAEMSQHHPAMAIGADGIPYFCWAGNFPVLENGQISLLHSENGQTSGFQASPNYKRTFYDTAGNGPALCALGGQMFVAWTGTDSGSHVNVAQLSRGAVAVYGQYYRSLVNLARSLQTNKASGIVTGLGRQWPPPPPISVRSLFS